MSERGWRGRSGQWPAAWHLPTRRSRGTPAQARAASPRIPRGTAFRPIPNAAPATARSIPGAASAGAEADLWGLPWSPHPHRPRTRQAAGAAAEIRRWRDGRRGTGRRPDPDEDRHAGPRNRRQQPHVHDHDPQHRRHGRDKCRDDGSAATGGAGTSHDYAGILLRFELRVLQPRNDRQRSDGDGHDHRAGPAVDGARQHSLEHGRSPFRRDGGRPEQQRRDRDDHGCGCGRPRGDQGCRAGPCAATTADPADADNVASASVTVVAAPSAAPQSDNASVGTAGTTAITTGIGNATAAFAVVTVPRFTG